MYREKIIFIMRILTSNLSFLWEEAMSALGEFGHCIVVSCVVLGEDICGGSFFLSLLTARFGRLEFSSGQLDLFVISYCIVCCICLNVIRS